MSRYRLSFICVLLFIMLISLNKASSQQEITIGNDFIIGARSAGMGGAFASIADDFTALYWNPAGLSQIKQIEFFGSLSHEKLEYETSYFNSPATTFISSTKPNSLGIVLPIPTYQGGLAFAFGVNRVQSFDSRRMIKGFNELSVEEEPEFGQLYIDELNKEFGGIYAWSLGAAVDIAPNVSLGGALNFLSGNYDYELRLDADDTKMLDSELTGFSYWDSINTDYFGVDGKIGLMAKIIPQVRLGLSIDVPLSFSAEEYWSQDSYYLYDDGEDESTYEDGTTSYDISRPFRFSGGISFHPIPEFAIAINATYTDWTQTKYSEPPSEDISNEDFINDYRDTLRINLGGEFTIPGLVKIRAGYIRDPLPYVPSNVEIKKDRQFITLGLGLVMDQIFSIDLAYIRGLWKESVDNGTIEKNRTSNRMLLSMGYRF